MIVSCLQDPPNHLVLPVNFGSHILPCLHRVCHLENLSMQNLQGSISLEFRASVPKPIKQNSLQWDLRYSESLKGIPLNGDDFIVEGFHVSQ